MRYQTTEEMLDAWNAGKPVDLVEMGGMGAGYEMAIQCAAFAVIEQLLSTPWAIVEVSSAKKGDTYTPRLLDLIDKAITDADAKQDDGSFLLGGLSGAQAGAAKNIAIILCERGPRALDEVSPERIITLTKACPRALYEAA